MKRISKTTFLPIGLLLFALLIVNTQQFCYMFNLGNAINGPKVVTHTTNYNGAGGNTTIKVGINPSSTNLAAFRIPILNNILIWNLQIATQKNTKPLSSSSNYDLESVTLHEMGHALGLGHTNLASESGLDHPQSEATAAYKGSDGTFNVNPGSDGVYGSSDDIRGDDLNFNYFNPSNNPFVLATPTDKSLYKNGLSYLPSGHKFATTGGIAESVSLVSKRDVDEYHEDLYVLNELAPVISYARHPVEVEEEEIEEEGGGVELGEQVVCSETLLSHPDRQKRIRSGTTEAIMQQGTYPGEYQRVLSADDVAALYYARAGVDEIAGTSDDYQFNIVYAGESTGNNIDVYLDPSYTSVGVTSASSKTLSGYHYSVNGASIRINPTISWYYNPLLATVIAFPSSQSQSIGSNAVMNLDLYFASAGPSSVSTSALTYTSSIGGSVSLNKIDGAHYSIQISGFSGSGTPCIQMSSTSLTDSKYSAKYESSNQICFSVSSSGSQPSVAASPSVSKSGVASSPSPSTSGAASSPSASKSGVASSPSASKSGVAASPSASKSGVASSPSASTSGAASPSVSKSGVAPSASTSGATSPSASKSGVSSSPSVSKSAAASNSASISKAASPIPTSQTPTKSPASSPSKAASPSATKSNAATASKASSPSATKSKSPNGDSSSSSSSSSSWSHSWWGSSSSESHHEVLVVAEANYYVEYVEDPLMYGEKRNMPNNFEKEVEEYIRVAENSGSILAQSILILPLIALLF